MFQYRLAHLIIRDKVVIDGEDDENEIIWKKVHAPLAQEPADDEGRIKYVKQG